MDKNEARQLNEVYDIARKQADEEIAKLKGEIEAIREESQAFGVLQKIEYDLAHNQMLKYVVLHRIKQAKEYRKKGGMTWVEFCDAIGEPQRTADRILSELQPVMDLVSAKLADFTGMDFSKIRMLGRSVSASLAEITDDGMVVIGDETIPLSPDYREDLQNALERIIAAKDDLLREKDATIRAKDKVLQSKADLIKRQEKDLARYEGAAAKKGLTAEEDALLTLIERGRIAFDGCLLQFDPEKNPLPPDATPRVRAAYIESLAYFRRLIIAAHDTAVDFYGDTNADNGWNPPPREME